MAPGAPKPADLKRLVDILHAYGYWLGSPADNAAAGTSFGRPEQQSSVHGEANNCVSYVTWRAVGSAQYASAHAGGYPRQWTNMHRGEG